MAEGLLERYRILEQVVDHHDRQSFLALDTETQQEVLIKALYINRLKDWKTQELFERAKNSQRPKSLTWPALYWGFWIICTI